LLNRIGDALVVRADDHAQVFGIQVRDISVEPITSQNRTVSCRRSACSLAPSRGDATEGDEGVGTAVSPRGKPTRVPHSGQKFAGAPQICPQAGAGERKRRTAFAAKLGPFGKGGVAVQTLHRFTACGAVCVVEM
jgi:hypothetical protein